MKNIKTLLLIILQGFLACNYYVYEPPRDNKDDPWGDNYKPRRSLTIWFTPYDWSGNRAPDTNLVLQFSEPPLTAGWTVTADGIDYTTGTWDKYGYRLTLDPAADFPWSKIINLKASGFMSGYDNVTRFPEYNISFRIHIVYNVSDTGLTGCLDQNGLSIPCLGTGLDGEYVNKPNARSFTGPTPHTTYTSDYTTKDNVTGLIWKTCSEGLTGPACSGNFRIETWNIAYSSCDPLNTQNGGAGYWGRTDWRLPTIEDLNTLPDYGLSPLTINSAYFPNTQANSYWTSTQKVDSTTYAWYVNFKLGYANSELKTNTNYIRCVAGP